MRNRALLISLVVVAALVAALVAGELYARHTIKSCMAQQFKDEIGTQVDVGLSPKPTLLQLIDKKVPYITIDSDDTSFGPAKDMHVHAKVRDIEINESQTSSGTVGSSEADVSWSNDGILTTMQEQVFGGLVSAVRSNETDGTLQFDVGPAGLAELTVKPHLVGDTVQVDTMDASLFGIGIPTDLVDGIVKVISASLQTYPLGMTPKSFKVTDTGLEISLSGGQFTMPPQNMDMSKCGPLS